MKILGLGVTHLREPGKSIACGFVMPRHLSEVATNTWVATYPDQATCRACDAAYRRANPAWRSVADERAEDEYAGI